MSINKDFNKYKKYIGETLQNSVEWKLLTEDEKDAMVKYMMENEEVVAEVLWLIMKEKELN